MSGAVLTLAEVEGDGLVGAGLGESEGGLRVLWRKPQEAVLHEQLVDVRVLHGCTVFLQ